MYPDLSDEFVYNQYTSSKTRRTIRNNLLNNDNRIIKFDTPNNFFPGNKISTGKYTPFTFVFLNLYEQFSKIANQYFLVLLLLQLIPAISITFGFPTISFPLSIFTILTMLKDGFEDLKRHKSDDTENNSKTEIWDDLQQNWLKTTWKSLKVGNIVKISRNEFFPADMLLIYSSDTKKGQCFIETKNLDGETNLKPRSVPADLKSYKTLNDVLCLNYGSIFRSEAPNPILNTFKGTLSAIGHPKQIPLDNSNFLLRGCSLKNTDYIIGCVTFTGHHTKVMKNSSRA